MKTLTRRFTTRRPATVEGLEGRVLMTGSFPDAAAVSMAYDADGGLHVAYQNSGESSLKYAKRSADGSWSDATVVDPALAAGSHLSVRVNTSGTPGVAYYDPAAGDLKYAVLNGAEWKLAVVDSKGDVGLHPSLAFDKVGRPLISYYSAAKQDLKLATFNGKKWKSSTVDAKGDTGRFSSIDVSPIDGSWTIAYESTSGGQVKIRSKRDKKAVIASWEPGAAMTGAPSVAFDSAGNPAVSFATPDSDTLMLYGPTQVKKKRLWTGTAVATGAQAGGTTSLDFTAGNLPLVVFLGTSQDVHMASQGPAGWSSMTIGGGWSFALDPARQAVAVMHDGGVSQFAPTLLPPPSLTATPAASGGVDLAWPAAPGATGYVVQRAEDGGAFSTIATVAAGATSLADPSATEGGSYTYRVFATSGGSSSMGAAAAAANVQLNPPTNLSATLVGGQIVLTWTDTSARESGFTVERSVNGGAWATVKKTGANVTTYTEAAGALTEGTAYTYRVSSVRGSTASAASATATAGVPLVAPTQLSSTAVTGAVALAWADNSGHESGYLVERSANGGPWATLGTVAANVTAYADTTLSPGNSYQYRVLATGPGGNSAPSNTAAHGIVAGVPTVFSQKWKDNWNAALAVNHPWAKLLFDNANASGTAGQRYSDAGDYGTYAFLLTGDVTYADKAWSIISSRLQPSSDTNFLRYTLTRYTLLYYGLEQGGYWAQYPDRRETFTEMLNTWCDATLNQFGHTFYDSDNTVGALGVTLWALVSQGENAHADTLMGDPRLGGLTVTSNRPNTVRNAVADYCRKASGGQWIESTGYNLETIEDLIMATEGIRAVTGRDHFPEVTAFYRQAALSEMAIITPDLLHSFQWGDVEWPRQLQQWYRVGMLGMLAGVTQDDPIGPSLQGFIHDFADEHGWTGFNSAEPWGQIFFCFNPVAPEADWRNLPAFAAPPGGMAVIDHQGQGFTFIREGSGPNATFAGLLNYTSPNVDHALPNASDFQLYHNGEWVVTHPIGYATNGLAANTTLIAGYGVITEATGRVSYEVGAGGSYVYSAGSAGGSTVWDGYWNPPTTFIHEMTRSMFYLPAGTPSGVPTLILFDRMNADIPDLTGYHYTADRDRISNSPLKQVTFHSPVAPAIQTSPSSSSLSWQTPGGQDVRVDVLATSIDIDATQTTMSVIGGFVTESEQEGYMARVVPTAYRKWDTFTSVVQAGNLTSGVWNESVSSWGGEARGAIIHREGADDVVVLFNARQASDLPPAQTQNAGLIHNPDLLAILAAGRLHTTGFTMEVTTATNSALVHVADLDMAKNWTVSIDGAAPVAFPVSAAGLGHLTLPSQLAVA
jgi:hypothetical protein